MCRAPCIVCPIPCALIVAKHLPPEGAWWLRNRVDGKVETLTATSVDEAREDAGNCVLTLSANGNRLERRFDHVIAGTGFKVDVDRLGLLDAGLRQAIRPHHGIASSQPPFRDQCRAIPCHRPCLRLEFRASVSLCRRCALHGSNLDPPFRGPSLMRPILFFFPGAGPPGDVAETLGRLFPEVEVVGITYPAVAEPHRSRTGHGSCA